MKKYNEELNERFDWEEQFTKPEAKKLSNFKELKKRFNDLEIRQGLGFLTDKETKEIRELRKKLFKCNGSVEIIKMDKFL